jgi:cytosine permease
MNNTLTFKVPEWEQRDWLGIAFVHAGRFVCVPVFALGGMLINGFSFAGAMLCVFVGFSVLWAYGCFVGMRSHDTGLPSVAVSAEGMGLLGARFVISLLLSVACVGWFGIQSAACGSSFAAITAKLFGVSAPPAWVCTVFWGAAITFATMFGFRSLKFLSYITTPVLLLILVFMLCTTLPSGGAAALLAHRPETPMSFASGISSVMGSFALGALITGDYCRYAKSRRTGVVLPLSLSLLVVGPVSFFAGAVFSVVAGDTDITVLLADMGMPAVALIAMLFAAWTNNLVNAYSGAIAVSLLLGLKEKRFKLTAAVTGIIGTALGAAGILSLLLEFLSLISSLIPPVAGVIVAASLTRCARGGFSESNGQGGGWRSFSAAPGFRITGIAAYGLGALTAWLTVSAFPFFIPPLNGILVAMIAYMILERLFSGRAK